MRKKLTRPQIEEIVRAKLKNKLSEQGEVPGSPALTTVPPVKVEPPPPMPGPPAEKAAPPSPNMYGGQDDMAVLLVIGMPL